MRLLGALMTAWVVSTVVMAEDADAQKLYDFKIDKEQSFVVFKIKNRETAFVLGRFNDVDGKITVDDRRNPKVLKVEADVNSRSVDTNNHKRDRHLKGKDFFDTSKYKSIKFVTKETKKLEEKHKFELTGELTLLGVTKPLTVTFEHTGYADMSQGKYRIGGFTTFTIRRSDFGMKNDIPSIADEVEVMVSLEAEMLRAPAG